MHVGLIVLTSSLQSKAKIYQCPTTSWCLFQDIRVVREFLAGMTIKLYMGLHHMCVTCLVVLNLLGSPDSIEIWMEDG